MNTRKRCSCCGENAGTWAQWHNMDTGHGLCGKCATWIETRPRTYEPNPTADEMTRRYGVAGINREAPR